MHSRTFVSALILSVCLTFNAEPLRAELVNFQSSGVGFHGDPEFLDLVFPGLTHSRVGIYDSTRLVADVETDTIQLTDFRFQLEIGPQQSWLIDVTIPGEFPTDPDIHTLAKLIVTLDGATLPFTLAQPTEVESVIGVPSNRIFSTEVLFNAPESFVLNGTIEGLVNGVSKTSAFSVTYARSGPTPVAGAVDLGFRYDGPKSFREIHNFMRSVPFTYVPSVTEVFNETVNTVPLSASFKPLSFYVFPPNVPEPSTLTLASLAAFAAIRRGGKTPKD